MEILIIEDEQAAVRRIKKIIREINPEINILADLDSIENTITWIDQHGQPDLMIMDIHLADGSSFEIFNHHQINCPIIFTTAYDQYAVDAFKTTAIDYLLKPVKKDELSTALSKIKSNTPKQGLEDLLSILNKKPASNRFLIRLGQKLKVIEYEEAAYFYTENKITFLVDFKGKRYPLDYSLDSLDKLLDENRFFRINRQIIIQINSIDEMIAYSKSRVKIKLNPPTEFDTIVSTERSPVFKKWLTGARIEN